jgi:carbon monoxide dehydrogenase subunit G
VDLQHTFTVPAPVDQAWATLLDVEGIAPCFPGATLTGVDGEEFSGTVKVKLGPVSLQYAGKGRFLEKDETTHTARIEAQGTDRRGNGTAGASVHARLEPAGEAETRVVVDTELKITGRPAQFGRSVVQDVSTRILDQFATCLAQRLGERGTAAAEPAAPAGEPEGDADGTATSMPEAGTPEVTPPESTPSESTPSEPPPPVQDEPAITRRPQHLPTAREPREEPAAELDLNAVVLPVLARQYGPRLLAALLALLVAWLVVRRRR